MHLLRLGTHEASVEYKESRNKLKQGIRRAKRGHEKVLASRIKENLKAFYVYIEQEGSQGEGWSTQGQAKKSMRGARGNGQGIK